MSGKTDAVSEMLDILNRQPQTMGDLLDKLTLRRDFFGPASTVSLECGVLLALLEEAGRDGEA